MWIIAIVLTLLIVLGRSAFINNQKDKEELFDKTLDGKFNVIVNLINLAAFDGEGEVRYIDKKHFNLYPDSSNQIVNFLYSQGVLQITWKYKYLQKEMIYKRNLSNVRNLSLFEQKRIGLAIIAEMGQKIQEHKNNVWTDV